jgi:hypothetical protein
MLIQDPGLVPAAPLAALTTPPVAIAGAAAEAAGGIATMRNPTE